MGTVAWQWPKSELVDAEMLKAHVYGNVNSNDAKLRVTGQSRDLHSSDRQISGLSVYLPLFAGNLSQTQLVRLSMKRSTSAFHRSRNVSLLSYLHTSCTSNVILFLFSLSVIT